MERSAVLRMKGMPINPCGFCIQERQRLGNGWGSSMFFMLHPKDEILHYTVTCRTKAVRPSQVSVETFSRFTELLALEIDGMAWYTICTSSSLNTHKYHSLGMSVPLINSGKR